MADPATWVTWLVTFDFSPNGATDVTILTSATWAAMHMDERAGTPDPQTKAQA